MFQGLIEVAVRISGIAKGAARKTGHAPDMTGGERDGKAIGGSIGQPFDAVGPEVVVFALLAIGYHWRARGLELEHRIPDRLSVEGVEAFMHTVADRRDGIDQLVWARDTADRLGRDFHF